MFLCHFTAEELSLGEMNLPKCTCSFCLPSAGRGLGLCGDTGVDFSGFISLYVVNVFLEKVKFYFKLRIQSALINALWAVPRLV